MAFPRFQKCFVPVFRKAADWTPSNEVGARRTALQMRLCGAIAVLMLVGLAGCQSLGDAVKALGEGIEQANAAAPPKKCSKCSQVYERQAFLWTCPADGSALIDQPGAPSNAAARN